MSSKLRKIETVLSSNIRLLEQNPAGTCGMVKKRGPKGIVVDPRIPFGIGSEKIPGLSKLTEEMAETQVEVGKIMGAQTMGDHWDKRGKLKTRLEHEIADTMAAQRFVIEKNKLNYKAMEKRAGKKLLKFHQWHQNIQEGRDPNDNGPRPKPKDIPKPAIIKAKTKSK
jgi:hypothetical protein